MALRGGRWADQDRFLSILHMQGMPAGFRIDSHRADFHLSQGSYDSAGNRANSRSEHCQIGPVWGLATSEKPESASGGMFTLNLTGPEWALMQIRFVVDYTFGSERFGMEIARKMLSLVTVEELQ